jgi:hypothetical protein
VEYVEFTTKQAAREKLTSSSRQYNDGEDFHTSSTVWKISTHIKREDLVAFSLYTLHHFTVHSSWPEESSTHRPVTI